MTLPRGFKYVGGRFEGGQLILTREDGSEEFADNVILVRATLIDNGDGTYGIEFPEE